MEQRPQEEQQQRFCMYGFHFNIVGAEPQLDGSMHVKLKHRTDDAEPGGLWDFQCYAGNLFKQIPELAEIVMANGISHNWDSRRDGLSKMLSATGLAVEGSRLSGSLLHFRGNKLKADALVIVLQNWNSILSASASPFLKITDRSFHGLVSFAKEYKKESQKEEK